MKRAREDQRKVTLKYRFDRETGRTTLTVDVEVPEDDMPHEHRRDLKEMAEELLGVPLGSLPADVEVRLSPGHHGKTEDHDHDHEHGEAHGHERREPTQGKQGIKH